MVLTTSTPNEINFQSLRKRKRNDALHGSLFDDNRLSQTIDESTECENKENNHVLTDCTYDSNCECSFNKDSASLINDSIEVKEEDLRNAESESVSDNDSIHSRITVCKVEDSCADPRRDNEWEDVESTNVKTENDSRASTPSTLHINPEDSLSEDIKTETEVHRKEKRCNSNDGTPNKKKRRRLSSNISNYDLLSDGLKTELCNNEYELIDMLHDLSDALINFRESDIITDIFCSTTDNAMETEEDTEKTVDPEADPLVINENEITDNVKDRKVKSENNENTDNDNAEMDDYIKQVLGELDIELSENKESEDERTEESDDSDPGELSENALKNLYSIKIKLMHEVPEQHKVEHTAGTKSLTKIEKKRFLRHGPMKTGQFTPTEDEIIKKNWNTFCETHHWNPKSTRPFIKTKEGTKFYIKSLKERRKFSQFLANGLPWRTLYSVYHRFRYLYGGHDTTFKRYSAAEDEKILAYVNKTDAFVKLSKILHRSKGAIWKHYQRIQKTMKNKKSVKSKVKWTLELIGKFIKTFMHVTLSETVEDLKDAVIPKSVWRKIQKKLGIDSYVLSKFWLNQLHMQLFSPEPIYLNDIRIKLIEYAYGKGISSTREIVWSNVAKYFDGITTVFLCRTFLYLVHQATIKLNTKYFPDIIEYLYSKKIGLIINDKKDKFLPRLTYSEGVVKIKDEDA